MATDDEINGVWMKMHVTYPYYQDKLIKKYGGPGIGEKQAADELTLLLKGVWMEVLSDMPSHALQAAALNYIADGNTYFPQAGDLRQRCFAFMDRANGDECDPYSAWDEAKRNAHKIYPGLPMPDIKWSDPLAELAMRTIGGSRAIRFCEESKLVIIMSQFVKAYMCLANRKQNDRRMLPQVRRLIERLSMDNMLASLERDEAALPDPAADPTLFNC